MRPTPLPADDTPADPESDRLADLDDRLRGDGPDSPSGRAQVGDDTKLDPRLPLDDVDLLLRLNQAGAAHRERAGGGAPEAPARFGRFEIVREAGRGGFATVYEAVDTFLRRRVALKVAHPGVLVSAGLRARFLREAELASRLDHPRLVTIHEVGECDGLCYIAEEFCDGGSLAAWLDDHPGPVEPRGAAAIVLAIAEGLQVAHASGISHRDIKPENVLLASARGEKPVIPAADGAGGWMVKLGDFGLGKLADEASAETPLVQLTREGARLGTPAWMAPEQIDRAIGPIGPATDVHALGLLLDRLLTGRGRWSGMSDSQTLRMILLHDPDADPVGVRGVPADLVAVRRRCLARRPEARYASAAELASDLARFLVGLPTVARPLTPAERGWRLLVRHPTASAIAVAALTLAIVAGFGLRERVRQEDEIRRGRSERRSLEAALELRRGIEMLRAGKAAAALEHLRTSAGIDPSLAASSAGRWFDRRIHGEVGMLLAPAVADDVPADGDPPRNDLYCQAVSGDGGVVAVGGADGRLRLVRLDAEGRPTAAPQSIPAHDEINDIAFSPDGRLVATAGEDGRVRLVLAADGTPAGDVAAAGRPLFAVAFSPDGGRLAWAGADRSIRILPMAEAAGAAREPADLRPFDDARGAPEADIESMLFLDDRRIVVSCGARVAVVDAGDGAVLREFVGHDPRSVVGHVALSADGSRLLSAGTDAVPRVWDIATGKLLLALPRHPAWVQGGGFTPDGRRIVTGCKDGVIRVFDATTGELENRLVGHAGRTWDVRCTAGGWVLSVGADGTLRRWDPARPPELAGTRSVPVTGDTILAFAPMPAPKAGGGEHSEEARDAGRSSLLVIRGAEAPQAIDTVTGEVRPLPGLPAGEAVRLSIDAVGRRCVLHGARGGARIWPLDGGPPRSIPGVDEGYGSAWTGSGQLVVADFERRLWVCDAALGRAVTIDTFAPFIDAVALSPADRQRVAAGGGDLVRLHVIPSGRLPEAGAGRTLVRLPPEFGKVYRLAWSNDGRRLAVGSGLGSVCVIDAEKGGVIGTFPGLGREIVGLAWSADDRLLFTADLESVRVCDTVTTVMLDELRPGFDIDAVGFLAGDPAAAGGRLVIAGGSSALVMSVDERLSRARLLVVDFDR